MREAENLQNMGDLFAAMAKAQGEFEPIHPDSDNYYDGKYASLGAMITATRPALAANGLAVMQFPRRIGEAVEVRTVLTHSSGTAIEDTFDAEPARFDIQGIGATVSYLRRYSYAALLCLTGIPEYDGEKPSAPRAAGAELTPAQIEGADIVSAFENAKTLDECSKIWSRGLDWRSKYAKSKGGAKTIAEFTEAKERAKARLSENDGGKNDE